MWEKPTIAKRPVTKTMTAKRSITPLREKSVGKKTTIASTLVREKSMGKKTTITKRPVTATTKTTKRVAPTKNLTPI